MNLNTIKNRCTLDADTGCWHWAGALSDNRWPRVWAPNLAKPGQPMETQTGRRAVWQIHTGRPIPAKHRVHGICDAPQCLNPAHMRCGPASLWGAHLTASGKYKNTPARTIANRASARARSKLTPSLLDEIQRSPETGLALQARLGLSNSVISKVRRGESRAWQSAANPFAGLMERKAA